MSDKQRRVPYESRQGQQPSAQFFAEVAAILKQAFPEIEITKQVMATLKPTFTAAWRRGYNARKAATLACRRCDEGLEPSPAFAAEAKLPKGAVRAPKGAQRGEVFGAAELRPPARVERRLWEIEVQQDAIAAERAKADALAAKGKSDKAKAARDKAAEMAKVLVELQEKLEAEWPQSERHAPAKASRKKKQKAPAPPTKEPKPKPAKKEPKPKVAKAKKEPKPKVAKAKKPKVEKEPKPKEPKAKMDKPKKEPPPPQKPAEATPSAEDKAALALLEQLMSNRANQRAGKK